MSLNWTEVSKSVKEGERQRGGSNRRLVVKDGEAVDLRLIGAATGKEPFIYKRHYDAKTERYFPCGEDAAKAGDHQGCVCCMVARMVRGEGKGARLKAPQRVYVVTVFDSRKFHFVESKPKGEQYPPCTEDEACRYCRKGLDRKISGVRYWEMAENLITQLRQFEINTLGKRCVKCEAGRIKITGYQCPVCEAELEPDDPNEEMRCLSCEKEMGEKPVERKPKEIVSCSRCASKGRRVSLADAWITVSVSGQRAAKTWNFAVGNVEPFDAAVYLKEFPDTKKIAPLPLAEMTEFQALPAAEQAAALNVPNPFAKSTRRDEDEDDDPSPKKKKKGGLFDEAYEEDDDASNRKKKKPVDDDEDSEEQIF